MIVSANQPYFAPFPGFFLKAFLSDILVILDAVQFPRGTTWLTRNRFKNERGALWLTIPVWKKGLGFQRIDKVRICPEGRWSKKHLHSLRHAYGNAPYFGDHQGFLEHIFSSEINKLIDMNFAIITYLLSVLQIDTKVIRLSDLGIEAKGDQLLLEICKMTGASHFLAQKPAGKYHNPELFQRKGIQLKYFSAPIPVYPQLWGNFIPNLSVLDLIFNCGPKARELLVKVQGSGFKVKIDTNNHE